MTNRRPISSNIAQSNSALRDPILNECRGFFTSGQRYKMLSLFNFYDVSDALDIQCAKLALEAVIFTPFKRH